jgi:hypothetical protein
MIGQRSVPRFQAAESGTLVPVPQPQLVDVASAGSVFRDVPISTDVRESPMLNGASPVIAAKTRFLWAPRSIIASEEESGSALEGGMDGCSTDPMLCATRW